MTDMKNAAVVPKLFFSMLKIGLFTFGGGYAMIALLEREFVDKKKWLGKDEFLDMVAIAESTPGPVAINGATYVGYTVAGFFGALLSTVAVCIPSFVIIYVISLFFDAFLSLTYVAYAFEGIRVCVAYLVLSAGVRMLREMKKNPLSILLLCVVTVGVVLTTFFAVNFSSVLWILLGAVLGLAVYALGRLREKGGKRS